MIMAVFLPANFQCSNGVEEILHAVNRSHTGKGLAILVADPLALAVAAIYHNAPLEQLLLLFC